MATLGDLSGAFLPSARLSGLKLGICQLLQRLTVGESSVSCWGAAWSKAAKPVLLVGAPASKEPRLVPLFQL